MIRQKLMQQVQFRSVTLLLLEPCSSSHFETEAKAFGLQYSAGGNVLTINPIVMDLPLIINVSLLLQPGKKGGRGVVVKHQSAQTAPAEERIAPQHNMCIVQPVCIRFTLCTHCLR